MRLISRFSDYYDGVRAIDRDDEPLYVRDTERHELAGLSVAARRSLLERVGALWSTYTMPPIPEDVDDAGRVVVGFCGRAYAGFRVGVHMAWDVDGVIALLRQIPDAAAWDRGLDVDRAIDRLESTRASSWYQGLNRATWRRFTEMARPDVGAAPFVAFRAPIVVVTDEEVVVNARLSDWGFASQVDPYNAWQELSVFLGNALANLDRREPRPIDDTLKAHAHGFDGQSFKNPKGRKKANRSDW
jgi:hypothetical protein